MLGSITQALNAHRPIDRLECGGSLAQPAGALKELVFELSGDRARVAHLRYLLEHPGMTLVVESLQAGGEIVWEVARVTGTAQEIADLRAIVTAPPEAPVAAVDLLEDDARSLRWVIRWERGCPDGARSLFHIVFDAAGAEALVFPRVHGGRIEVRVNARSLEGLRKVYARVEAAYNSRWAVRLLRIGDPRQRAVVATDDRALLARALEAGYYDEPKRVGVRELGDALGWSKTVTSRRLRALERKAVEQMAGD